MKILVIDLENKEYSYIEDEKMRPLYIGGVGINTYLFYRYTDRKIDPMDEENNLFISSGAFAGTNISTASRCEVTALSPTGYFGTSNTGGGLGVAIKFCNIDSVWIKGKALSPVYLKIDEKGVLFRDARTLGQRYF